MGAVECVYPFDTSKYEVLLTDEDFFPHMSPSLKHAKDFLLPFDAPILVAHRGEVLKVKSDSDKHFTSKEFFYKMGMHYEDAIRMCTEITNAVCIGYKDKRFDYFHFGKGKVFVKEGQEVKEGELIGHLGFSGLFDYLHLHFNAYVNKGGKSFSIPVKFKPINK